jgi:hypothetical protein
VKVLSVEGVPTFVFTVLAVLAALALVSRSAQIVGGSMSISSRLATVLGIASVAVVGITYRGESGRRVSEILILAAISYVVPSLGKLKELSEEYLDQRSGDDPSIVAAHFFYKVIGIGALLFIVSVLFIRGW